VVGASALLRVAAFLGLASVLAVYYATSESWWSASTWWDVAFLAFVLIPAVFALVYLALPWWNAHGLLLVGLAFVVLAVVLQLSDLDAGANFAKLGAATALAFWFLFYFESASWVVIVALIVPWVDAYSVWRGPTRHIISEQKELFTTLSFAFPIPGEHGSANLGLPDLVFFALFLAATARFGLRRKLTWALMTASFGATMALAVYFDLSGLPALPLLCLAFLAPNADLLYRKVSAGRRSRPARP
jgi:Ca2+/Na+ antiporter